MSPSTPSYFRLSRPVLCLSVTVFEPSASVSVRETLPSGFSTVSLIAPSAAVTTVISVPPAWRR